MTAALLSFVAAACVAGGFGLLLPPVRKGASAWRERPRHGIAAAALVHLLAGSARRLAPVTRIAAPEDLARRIAAAGLGAPGAGPLAGLDARELMAAKLALAVLCAVGGLVLGALAPGRLGILVAAGSPVAGFLAPDLWLVRRARERARRVRRELPGMLDLLRVTVEAGLSLTAALEAVGERTRGTLGSEWRAVGREVALGVPLGESLHGVAARVPVPEVAALVGALERALRHGAPLADTLAAQAHDTRAARSRLIRETAARAGPKIQLVVALLLVPSVLLLIAAALVAALVDGGAGLPLG